MRSRHVEFVISGARTHPGGIAAVNLNLLIALCELVEEHGISFGVLSLCERDGDRPDFLPDSVPFRGFADSKVATARALLGRTAARPLFFFERVGLAAPLLPLAASGLARSVLFAHSPENWHDMRKVDLWSIQAAELIITNSRFTLNKMREAVSRFHGVACPLGLSPAFKLNERPPEPNGETMQLEAVDGERRALGGRVLLLVGRMYSIEGMKGHRELIRILPALEARFPGVQLVFPGTGDDRPRIAQLARDTGVASSVFIPGHVPAEVLDRLYRLCYGFVMPSRQEGFGLVYLEAMNWAKPCVGCFDDGAEDVIVHRETGLLLRDPRDPQELELVLGALLEDPERARGFGRRGFERLRTNFTAEAFRERFKACFTPLLGRPR